MQTVTISAAEYLRLSALRERMNQNNRDYYLRHREQVLAQQQAHYRENREAIATRKREARRIRTQAAAAALRALEAAAAEHDENDAMRAEMEGLADAAMTGAAGGVVA
jgi:hypothetical protein